MAKKQKRDTVRSGGMKISTRGSSTNTARKQRSGDPCGEGDTQLTGNKGGRSERGIERWA